MLFDVATGDHGIADAFDLSGENMLVGAPTISKSSSNSSCFVIGFFIVRSGDDVCFV
jgi:hypothetical protein